MGDIRCNQCGRQISVREGDRREDCVKVVKEWGYFSKKDGEIHTFYLCEDCYDKLLQGFQLPVRKEPATELL